MNAHSSQPLYIRMSALWLALALCSCGGNKRERSGPDPVSGVVEKTVDDVNRLTMLARGTELTTQERQRLSSAGDTEHRAFLSTLARSQAAAEHAGTVIMPMPLAWNPPWLETSALSSFKGKNGEDILFFRKPCAEEESVEVQAWWQPDKPVRVCAKDHEPDKLMTDFGMTCMPSFNGCGCGPYLMACTASTEMSETLKASYRKELVDTIGYLLGNGFTLKDLFQHKHSFRDRRAEIFYRRARVLAGEAPDKVFADLQEWPEHGQWAPRSEGTPGQHAGILTTAQMLYLFIGHRERVQAFQEIMWCVEARSVRVDTEQIFALGTPNFRNEHQDGLKLANMPVCDGCHARLDHAVPFFRAHARGTIVTPRDPERTMPMYLEDRHDKRSNPIQAHPEAYARLATSLPEFGQCMTRRVVDHVFADSATSEDYQRVHDTYRAGADYQAMLEVALLRRYERTPPGPATQAPGDTPDDPSGHLDSLLEQHCTSCHGEGEAVDLEKKPRDRHLLLRALEEVYAERMPKVFPPMGWGQREQLLRALVSNWPVAAERPGLSHYFSRSKHNLSAHRPQTMQRVIRDRVDAHSQIPHSKVPTPYDELGRGELERSPDLLLFMATEAVRACKHKSDGDLATCAVDATRPLSEP